MDPLNVTDFCEGERSELEEGLGRCEEKQQSEMGMWVDGRRNGGIHRLVGRDPIPNPQPESTAAAELKIPYWSICGVFCG